MILCGDVGGTHTRLALAERVGGRFRLHGTKVFPSDPAAGLARLVERYLEGWSGAVEAAGFGIPGPVTGRRVRTTNLPWVVDADELQRKLGCRVVLVNDLEAAAHGVLLAAPEDLATLQEGEPAEGNRAVIAAGTGLGEALILRHGGRWFPCASEGGHTDFGPRDEEEVELWRFLRKRHGHVSYERIVSGPGLVDLYAFETERRSVSPIPFREGEDRAAAISRAGLSGACPAAVAALDRFCSIYGAEAGNLALKALARGGVYVAGGIAPAILERLRSGPFLQAFRDKGRYRELLERVPVRVVLDGTLALKGAARAVAEADGGAPA
ncbi:MAG: glucokinase [Acidobacteria bacterium]|nr:MAG: glucokinase [Acidobacteriota bacterium]